MLIKNAPAAVLDSTVAGAFFKLFVYFRKLLAVEVFLSLLGIAHFIHSLFQLAVPVAMRLGFFVGFDAMMNPEKRPADIVLQLVVQLVPPFPAFLFLLLLLLRLFQGAFHKELHNYRGNAGACQHGSNDR